MKVKKVWMYLSRAVDSQGNTLEFLLKRRVKPGLGFFAMESAWRTLQGYEVMNRIRKGQVQGMERGDIMGQIAFIASLFGVAA